MRAAHAWLVGALLASCGGSATPASHPPPGRAQPPAAPAPPFDGEVHVHETGPADGPPMVLVHGLGERASADFDPIVPALAAEHRVLAVDLPGFGRSDPVVYSLLGGRRVLEGRIRRPEARQFAAAIREGLPASALEAFVETADLPASQVIDLLGMSRRTWARRKREGAALTAVESDRLYRLVRTVARASEVLGSRDKGLRWMQKPNRALGGDTPLGLLDTEVGERQVEDLLDRIDHGVFG